MTVGELIEMLGKWPKDTRVAIEYPGLTVPILFEPRSPVHRVTGGAVHMVDRDFKDEETAKTTKDIEFARSVVVLAVVGGEYE